MIDFPRKRNSDEDRYAQYDATGASTGVLARAMLSVLSSLSSETGKLNSFLQEQKTRGRR